MENQEIEGLEKRLDIKSVNDGKDYIFNQDAVDSFGWISQVVTWDDVTDANNLKRKAEEYLTSIQYANVVIEAKAVDLHWMDESINRFKLSSSIRVVSKAHGMDKCFRLTKQTLNLNNPESDTVTLGKEELATMTSKSATILKDVQTMESSILEDATRNATSLITNAMGGTVYKTRSELYIMDSEEPAEAQNVWRWNIGGLGFSNNGIDGPYGLAMTMDGAIVADKITTGTISGVGMRLGGRNNGNGICYIDDNDGNHVVQIDNNGISLYKGASITSNNGIYSVLTFPSDIISIGYSFLYNSLQLPIEIPGRFNILSAYLYLRLNPTKWTTVKSDGVTIGTDIIGYPRNVKVYASKSAGTLTGNISFTSAIIPTATSETSIASPTSTQQIVSGDFTASGVAGGTSPIVYKSGDIKNLIQPGSNLIYTVTTSSANTDLERAQASGSAQAILMVTGYTK